MNDDRPMRLKYIADEFKISVGSLRAEAERGRLAIYKIGGLIYTTRNDVMEMKRLCLVEPKAPASISIRRAINTSSETARASLDAAQQTLLKLRNTSRNISPRSTNLFPNPGER